MSDSWDTTAVQAELMHLCDRANALKLRIGWEPPREQHVCVERSLRPGEDPRAQVGWAVERALRDAEMVASHGERSERPAGIDGWFTQGLFAGGGDQVVEFNVRVIVSTGARREMDSAVCVDAYVSEPVERV